MAFSFDNLGVFLAVMEHGSFSAAARRLGRVPSAISMSIGHLEADIGLLLFDRAGREPKPTPHALALLPQARLLMEQLRKLDRHALSLSQGLETRLTLVVVPELLAAAPWSQALATLSAEYPLLEVEVLAAPQADALGMVQVGRAQLALVFERLGVDAREEFQEVAQETLIAVVSPAHPLLARDGFTAVRDEHLLSERQIIVAGRHSEDVDKRIAISRHQWRTDNPVAALQMVMAGLGWAWLPQGFVRAPLAAGQLVEIPAENFTNALKLWVDVVWAKAQPPGPAARKFIELMRGPQPPTALSA